MKPQSGLIVTAALLVLSLATQSPAKDAPAKKPDTSEPRPTGDEPTKFVPATKEESAAAIEKYKKAAGDVAEKLNVKLEPIETAHFLIFTNWDPREFNFLKENVEMAYSLVSRQFELPVAQNVFVGKLPIYMFAKKDQFEKFSGEIDKFDSSKLAGYYMGNSLGFGHMAMWKPDVDAAGGNRKQAERTWGYVLVHEFTHAFIARYRTNVFIPRWLNEGVAEVVASSQFPRADAYYFARLEASKGHVFISMLDVKEMSGFTASLYPLARTAVETLIAGGPKTFLKFFNDIKDGVDVDEALKKEYHTDRAGLEEAWKKYLKTVKQ